MKVVIFSLTLWITSASLQADPIRISTFSADVTPPIGSPLCFSFIKPAKKIEEPLTARGIVILGRGKPIVLCVADFVVLSNDSHDAWRKALAEAAETSRDRVAMHVIHNHDSPGYDQGASQLLDEQNLPNVLSKKEVHDKAPKAQYKNPE